MGMVYYKSVYDTLNGDASLLNQCATITKWDGLFKSVVTH
jgi:hypothetical protein